MVTGVVQVLQVQLVTLVILVLRTQKYCRPSDGLSEQLDVQVNHYNRLHRMSLKRTDIDRYCITISFEHLFLFCSTNSPRVDRLRRCECSYNYMVRILYICDISASTYKAKLHDSAKFSLYSNDCSILGLLRPFDLERPNYQICHQKYKTHGGRITEGDRRHTLA